MKCEVWPPVVIYIWRVLAWSKGGGVPIYVCVYTRVGNMCV